MSADKRPRAAVKRWVRKSDGRLEAFNRSKLRRSVLKAGASRTEASHVADTITRSVRAGALSEDVAGTQEVSSAQLANVVIQELRAVNKDAAARYSAFRVEKQQPRSALSPGGTSALSHAPARTAVERQRLEYLNRVNALASELTAVSHQASTLPTSIDRLNERVQRLSTRITRVRQENYRALSHLEADHAALAERWAALSPNLQATTRGQRDALYSKTRDLQQVLADCQRRVTVDGGSLHSLEAGITDARQQISAIKGQVAATLSPIEAAYQQLDQDLRVAEATVALVADASFPWEDGETPIIAAKAKDLTNDVEGILTLTNHRFIFEGKTEVVVKRRLFIVTEKKTVRAVAVQTPIGMVTQLTKGRVGLLKGTGLFVEFAADSGLAAMKFDTSGQDAEWLTAGYQNISSGHIDEELATTTPAPSAAAKAPQLVACQICGAPYTDQIYRGQTAVNCKYCGAVIAL